MTFVEKYDKIYSSEESVLDEVTPLSVVICITAGCGGQGSTSLAASLTYALASMGNTVAAVDAKSGEGALDAMLGTKETAVFNMGDVLMNRCELSDAVCRPKENIVFLAAAKKAEEAPLDALDPILAKLEKYDYMIIDMPMAESESANRLLSCADTVILCCTASLREMDRTCAMRRRMQRLKVDTRLVVTLLESDRMEVPDIDRCIDTVKARLLGVIPKDSGFSEGAFPMEGQAFEAVKRIARRIRGEKAEIPKM